MRVALLLLLIAITQVWPHAQAGLLGSWEGTFDVPGEPVKVTVVFRALADGWSGTVAMPQHGATGLGLRAITASGATVRFELATGGPVAVFDGRLDGDRLSGRFTQGSITGTVTLTRGKATPAAPPAPPPYRVEPLTITNGRLSLSGASSETQMRALRALVEAQAAIAGAGAAPADRAVAIERAVKGAAIQMASPWMRFMLVFDPATSLRSVTVPVFAAFGELDTQVPPSMHEAATRAALGANPRATITTYPSANHLFQRARTGQVAEYATLDKAFVPRLLDDHAKWILAASR
jgi:fermentation-respiration switch protein FrsA (DUF1100 family)